MIASAPLLIRADAGAQMGIGHVMRCLALAQAWQEGGGTPRFVLASAPPNLESRLSAEGISVVPLDAAPGSILDAQQTAALAQEMDAAWVVVDGYQFGTVYQQALKTSDVPVLFLDDYGHADHYYADLVLNQNIYAAASQYRSREPCTQLLLGNQYTLLRREFWPWRDWKREVPTVADKVLVTLGGADADNVTRQVIRALRQVDSVNLDVIVVVGGSNPHRASLRAEVETRSFRGHLVQDVTNMPELMACADLAISAGGSTCWEMAFMGLPGLVLLVAENQRLGVDALDKAGIFNSLGDAAELDLSHLVAAVNWLVHDPETRLAMSQKGRRLVDGYGAARVVACLREGMRA
jgi:UDP-2,4-diacetamido-2,4,6-trideoxy-beta-L-altropyranose hydrolase